MVPVPVTVTQGPQKSPLEPLLGPGPQAGSEPPPQALRRHRLAPCPPLKLRPHESPMEPLLGPPLEPPLPLPEPHWAAPSRRRLVLGPPPQAPSRRRLELLLELLVEKAGRRRLELLLP